MIFIIIISNQSMVTKQKYYKKKTDSWTYEIEAGDVY